MSSNDSVVLELTLESDQEPTLMDFTSLLYDFELLHDLSVMLNLEEYRIYLDMPSMWAAGWYGRFWTRRRPIKYQHKLKVIKISRQSPWEIILVVSSVVVASKALVPLIEAAGKIADWRFDRKKARHEAERAQFAAEKAQIELQRAQIEKGTALMAAERERRRLTAAELALENERTESRILKRLEKNPLKLSKLSIATYIIKEHEDRL
ncbi:MAG: hypothetical protein A2169_00530 [Deltaproteobacteria bacterium RBG_13_47_9]|nr:MAG: hypothetical protein A2169_00530 [Deltaproteobacteria bacterium RBG_13_47_9]